MSRSPFAPLLAANARYGQLATTAPTQLASYPDNRKERRNAKRRARILAKRGGQR